MEVEKDRLQNYYKNDKVQSPSFNFTDNVMAEVAAIAETPLVVPPLITKRAWVWIVGISIFVIVFSFFLELIGSIQEMPRLFDWSQVNWEDFTNSIRIVIGVVSLFVVLTLVDVIYRKMKRLA
ncbi:MAG: hypothetical protein R3279_03435 [Putridiphycobacter sp.]|nr:hypothetical protein [Putridiphycobacter sp.]